MKSETHGQEFARTDPTIDQLQLTVRATNALRDAGCEYLSDVLKLDRSAVRQIPNIGQKTAAEICALIDAASIDGDSSAGVSGNRNPRIETMGLTVRAINALRQYGYHHLSEVLLLDELSIRKIPNIGAKTAEEIADFIASESGRCHELSLSDEPAHEDSRFNPLTRDQAASKENLDLMRQLNLGLLSLSASEVVYLESQGLVTAFDAYTLLEQSGSVLTRAGALSQQALLVLKPYLAASGRGAELSRLLQDSPVTIVPSPNSYDGRKGTAKLFKHMFTDFIDLLPDSWRITAASRIWPLDSGQRTLEDVAAEIGVTRERVRQLEKKVLSFFTELLIEGRPVKVRSVGYVYLHPELFKLIRAIAERLSEVEEIEVDEMGSLVSEITGSSAGEVFELLPLFFNVLSGTTSNEFSRAIWSEAPSVYLSTTPASVQSLRVTDLRLGKSTEKFEQSDLFRVSDVLASAELSRDQGKLHFKRAFAAIDALSSSFNAQQMDSSLDDRSMVSALELYLYDKSLDTELAALDELIPWVESAIPHICSWSSCQEVFQMRTSRPAWERTTLQRTAESLVGKSNHGPTVARIEKYLIERLSTVIIDGDYRHAKVWVPRGIVALGRTSKSSYADCEHDYERFKSILHSRLGCDEQRILRVSHLLWAMNEGLLPNRYYHLYKQKPSQGIASQISQADLGKTKVKLKGFRSIH